MRPKEKAREMADRISAISFSRGEASERKLLEILIMGLEDAMGDERDACARIADRMSALEISKAIRNRSKTKTW